MKIKVLKCSSQNYWYENRVGEVFEVEQCKFNKADWHCVADSGSFEKGDCIEITQREILQEQLQTDKAIKEVGEDNLRKAWTYEMSIGLNV